MTSRIIVAIFAVFAVLSLAVPVAVEAQPVPVVFACSEAADTAVWRFYTPTSIPPIVHDFDARSNLPTDKIGLHVEQYAGDWNTRLSIPAGNLDPYATGSTRLQAGQWTNVGVQCEGAGEVTLTVTRRRDVSLRSVPDLTAPSEAGRFTGSCPSTTSEDEPPWTNRYFHIDPVEKLDFAVSATNPDTYIDVRAYKRVQVPGRSALSWFFITKTEGRGSLHTATATSNFIRPSSNGLVRVWCLGTGANVDEVIVTVTRREPVSLRR